MGAFRNWGRIAGLALYGGVIPGHQDSIIHNEGKRLPVVGQERELEVRYAFPQEVPLRLEHNRVTHSGSSCLDVAAAGDPSCRQILFLNTLHNKKDTLHTSSTISVDDTRVALAVPLETQEVGVPPLSHLASCDGVITRRTYGTVVVFGRHELAIQAQSAACS